MLLDDYYFYHQVEGKKQCTNVVLNKEAILSAPDGFVFTLDLDLDSFKKSSFLEN